MARFIPSMRETILVAIIVTLIGLLAYGALWFNRNYVLMPVPREAVEEVENCIDNQVGCGLVFSDVEDIPD